MCDIVSYLLGKTSSGGGSNNVFADTSIKYNANSGLKGLIRSVDLKNTSAMTAMNKLFSNCINLETVVSLDTSSVTDMAQMFYNCGKLKNLPILNTSKVTNLNQTFALCNSLTDESLDNILQMCINASSYTGTKTLYYLFSGELYNTSRIQALPHYQAFIDAGWTIGY